MKKVTQWRSTNFHRAAKAMLVVYVDDFKLAAPAHMHDMLWAAIKTKINIDTPTALEEFVGCEHEVLECRAADVAEFLKMSPDRNPRGSLP